MQLGYLICHWVKPEISNMFWTTANKFYHLCSYWLCLVLELYPFWRKVNLKHGFKRQNLYSWQKEVHVEKAYFTFLTRVWFISRMIALKIRSTIFTMLENTIACYCKRSLDIWFRWSYSSFCYFKQYIKKASDTDFRFCE